VGASKGGNTLLTLNRNSPLGPRGTIIALPRDRVVFESVRQEGSYSPDVSEFLRGGLDSAPQPSTPAALLDIGANTGLVSLQTMNSAKGSHEYFLFEPLPRHVEAIKHNLSNASVEQKVHVHQVALSNETGTATIFTEQVNHGNSSLLQEAIVYPAEQIKTLVKTVDTARFFRDFGQEFDRFVIKYDTQGMDALILSLIPSRIWERVQRVAVEVWALPHTDISGVERVLDMCKNFGSVSWGPELKEKIEFQEVFDFWTGKSSEEKNLFLSRT
jgi:FkbM family methyltransferase